MDKTFPIVLQDHTHFEPWHVDQSLMPSWPTRWVKTYIQITDVNEDGTPIPGTSETLRLRFKDKEGNVFACRPEDDDEPDIFPGCYWRE